MSCRHINMPAAHNLLHENIIGNCWQHGRPHDHLLGGAEYTIRMNFTTVPRTWISVNKWRHSVPIHYKASLTAPQLAPTHTQCIP